MDFLENTFLLNLYSLAAFLFLLFAFALQKARSQRLEKELDHVTHHYQKQSATPKSVRNELFETCPYPVCIVDLKGNVLFANKRFQELTPHSINSLTEFDHFTGAELHAVPLTAKEYTYRLVTMRRQAAHAPLRQFNLIAWPIALHRAQVGTVLSFHEQTHALRRRAQQFSFEQQLVSYLAHLSIRLGTSHHKSEEIEEYGKEVHLLTAYMQQIHAQVRQPNIHGAIDAVKILRETIQDYRTELRNKQIQVITTLPKEALVVTHHDDLQLICRSVLSAALLQAQKSTIIRFQTHSINGHLVLEYLLPERKLSEAQQEEAFSFGAHDAELNAETRLWRLQLAISREVVSKYNGQLAVVSGTGLGTSYRLTLVSSVEK